MVRPSHYLVVFTTLFVGVGWYLNWGGLGGGDAGSAGSRPAWLPEPTEIRGRILDRLGWPVADARVAAGQAVGDAFQWGDSGITDREGHFRLPPLGGPVVVDLRATAPGRQVWDRVPRASGDPVVLVLEDVLPWVEERDAPERPMAGTSLWAGDGFVKDAEGEPVRGAVVAVRETGASVRTDDVGHYIVPLPNGTASILAYGPRGLVAGSEPFRPPAGRREGLTPLPTLVMEPGATVRGVLRSPEGDPLEGAAVVLAGNGTVRRAESQDDGLFRISALLGGEYELTVLPCRGALGFRMPVVVGGDVDLQDLALVPERELRVQVVRESGEPQARAHVVAEEAAGLRRAHAEADELGWATLIGLAGRDPSFEVRRADDFDLLPVVRVEGDQLVVTVN